MKWEETDESVTAQIDLWRGLFQHVALCHAKVHVEYSSMSKLGHAISRYATFFLNEHVRQS
jgi:hypothetical protein